jgi:integrase
MSAHLFIFVASRCSRSCGFARISEFPPAEPRKVFSNDHGNSADPADWWSLPQPPRGWHAYRRGLATNLHELGVPDKVIQAILRHEDVSTTQRSYIKTVPRVVTDAMNQLEARIARAAVVQQVSVN